MHVLSLTSYPGVESGRSCGIISLPGRKGHVMVRAQASAVFLVEAQVAASGSEWAEKH